MNRTARAEKDLKRGISSVMPKITHDNIYKRREILV